MTETEARELVESGEQVFAVYDTNNRPKFFTDYDEAAVFAEDLENKSGRTVHVLDWETGDYA